MTSAALTLCPNLKTLKTFQPHSYDDVVCRGSIVINKGEKLPPFTPPSPSPPAPKKEDPKVADKVMNPKQIPKISNLNP